MMDQYLDGNNIPVFYTHRGWYGGKWNNQVRLVPAVIDLPLRWRKPRRVFVNSMGDLFHQNVPKGWLDAVFAVMSACPQHRFIALSKRPMNMRRYLGRMYMDANNRLSYAAQLHLSRLGCYSEFSNRLPVTSDRATAYHSDQRAVMVPLPNLCLGVTAEDQERANERIPDLLQTPAAMRCVSLEPLLGPVDLDYTTPLWWTRFADEHQRADFGPLDWVIVGAETGAGRRPSDVAWVRAIVEQCAEAGVACFVKQIDIGKRVSHDPAEWPEDLRVRQYPAGLRLDGDQ